MSRGRIVRRLQLGTIPLLRLDPGEGIPNWKQAVPILQGLLPVPRYLLHSHFPFSLHEVMTHRLMSTCRLFFSPSTLPIDADALVCGDGISVVSFRCILLSKVYPKDC
jgi:hypothetical protein